jgi:hypothetical protein
MNIFITQFKNKYWALQAVNKERNIIFDWTSIGHRFIPRIKKKTFWSDCVFVFGQAFLVFWNQLLFQNHSNRWSLNNDDNEQKVTHILRCGRADYFVMKETIIVFLFYFEFITLVWLYNKTQWNFTQSIVNF